MTPPNELEQLAEFQDAIQSDKGLERLRAMQYLQQMNNQGIIGLPQVRQQPVVRRQEPGPVFKSNFGEIGSPRKGDIAYAASAGKFKGYVSTTATQAWENLN